MSLLAVAAMVLTLMTAVGVSGAAAAKPECHPYPDVTSSNSACANIAWLKAQEITKPADGKYHPTDIVTRGSMVAFLFRLTHPGKSSPKCKTKPFPDVSTSNVFCGYISWAKKAGVAFGYANGTFGPGKAVTRGAMAAYLRRVATNRATPKCYSAPFKDVSVSSTFCGVITWAKANGITYGVGGGKYGTAAPVTRQAMASFLHRVADYNPAHDRVATVTTVTPFTKDGRVKFPMWGSGYEQPFSCVGSPLALGAGVYQCDAEHTGACWADTAGSPYLYCMDAADSTTVLRMRQPATLPKVPGNLKAIPWELVLDDGTVCGAWFNDLTLHADGWRFSYLCSGTYVAIGSNTKTPKPQVDTSTWTTQAVKTLSGKAKQFTVHVKHAYYAGAAPHVTPAKSGAACPSRAVLQVALGSGQTVTQDVIRCSGNWALSGVNDQGNGEPGLFHKTGGVWKHVERVDVCTLPSPIPASLYQGTCMVS